MQGVNHSHDGSSTELACTRLAACQACTAAVRALLTRWHPPALFDR